MEYLAERAKVEKLSLPIGEAVFVTVPIRNKEYGEGVFGEVLCEDPYILRIRKGEVRSVYGGVLLFPLDKTEQGYQRFKTLTDRLGGLSGFKLENDVKDYISCISKKTSIDLVDFRKNYPRMLRLSTELRFLTETSADYMMGRKFVRKEYKNFPKFPDIFEGVREKYFTRNNISHIEDKGFIITKFTNLLGKFNDLSTSIENHKECERIMGCLEVYMNWCIDEIWKNTEWFKGIKIHYADSERENVLRFFDYLLRGGAVPDIPLSVNFGKGEGSCETKAEKESASQVQPQTYKNPFEIDLPKNDKIDNLVYGGGD